ncbi:helix-turn-helix transcriptional regulator [Actinacidiphila acididurans]|uniref:helix-turn-helix transcriptional regulator n=1 Tax=Actinacidiphila acididurans TaxID=2784346 RepID=UPI0027DCB106|nr:helix-turn-helix transcriptional regulator [Actinacidiphila acididurans]
MTEVQVGEHHYGFGPELRRRRLAAGLTLAGLSARVHYSKAQLSKVERGLKAPSRELATLCDTVLRADGALTALVPDRPDRPDRPRVETVTDSNEEVWVMGMSVNGRDTFRSAGRRQVMAVGAASVVGLGIGGRGVQPDAEGERLLEVSRPLFDQYRQLGQTVGTELVLPLLVAQTHSLREAAAVAGPRVREALLRLASRYAEYAGWLIQETGDDRAALWWTEQAAAMANAGGDRDFAAYALVRHALVTLYRGDAPATVALARRAQDSGLPPRIRGLAAQREAQGHALGGDHDAAMRSLDRARTLLARHVPDPGAPVIGTTNLSDPVAMITGWCLYDLGRPLAAAETMDRQMAQVPGHALRTQVRYGIRRALAYGTAGEIEHACELTRPLLAAVTTVRSATVAADLRQLARVFARHPRNRAVRELAPEFGASLSTPTS